MVKEKIKERHLKIDYKDTKSMVTYPLNKAVPVDVLRAMLKG